MKSFITVAVLLTLGAGCAKMQNLMGKWKPVGVRPDQKEFGPSWIKNHDPAYNSGNLPIGLQGPTYHKGMIFAGHNSGEMRAYQANNGRMVWATQDSGKFHAGAAVYNDHVIYGNTEGRLFSRHYLTGNLQYSVDLGASIEAKPLVHQDRLVVHLRNHKVLTLDARTGKILWAYKRSVPFLTTLQRVSRPLGVDNRLYVGFADGHIVAFGLEDGALLWERKLSNGSKFIDVDMSPLAMAQGLLVGSSAGELHLLDYRTGRILQKLNYVTSRRPVEIKDHYAIGTVNGEVVIVNNKLREFKKIQLHSGGITALALWRDSIVVATTEGKVFRLHPSELSVIDVFNLGHANSTIFGDIEVGENTLAFLSSRNRLYVFQ